MKKFRFSLETVLDYKQQVLDSVQMELAVIVTQVQKQEEVLAAAECRYAATNDEFCQRKAIGLTIADAMSYELGLRVLEQEIFRETHKLDELRAQEAAKRDELIVSKIDTTSLEILRKKKLTDYNQAVQKSEEQFIDELVSAGHAKNSQMAMIG